MSGETLLGRAIQRLCRENAELKTHLEAAIDTKRHYEEKKIAYYDIANLLTKWRRECKCGAQKKLQKRKDYEELFNSQNAGSTDRGEAPGPLFGKLPLRSEVGP